MDGGSGGGEAGEVEQAVAGGEGDAPSPSRTDEFLPAGQAAQILSRERPSSLLR
jgi:hypothetical protein